MTAGGPKKLSLFDASMLVMGGIIGVGIFFNPSDIAALVPHTGAYMAMWIFGGCLALCGAMTFAELGATFPKTGGWYVYLREAFGRFPAFLFAWIVLFVVSTGASATVTMFAVSKLGDVVPALDEPGAAGTVALGAVLVAAITGLALRGAKAGALFQNACMLLKLAAIAVLALGGLLFFESTGAAPPVETAAVTAQGSLVEGMINAALPVLFSFGGWQMLTYLAPEVRDPERTLPLAITIGIVGVVATYLLLNASYLRVLGIDGLAADPGFAGTTARHVLGERGGLLLDAAMGISAVGVVTVILLATPAVYVAMAKDGLFFESFGRQHPTTGAPVVPLLVQAGLVVAYLVVGVLTDLGTLVGAVVFAEWIFHALVAAALLSLRARRPDLPRPFRSWAYPLLPVGYLLAASAVLIGNLLRPDARTLGISLGVLAVGAATYLPWQKLVRARRSA